MPRRAKGPRLWLRPRRGSRPAAWFILDGTWQRGTGSDFARMSRKKNRPSRRISSKNKRLPRPAVGVARSNPATPTTGFYYTAQGFSERPELPQEHEELCHSEVKLWRHCESAECTGTPQRPHAGFTFRLKSNAFARAREQELEADQRRPQVHRTLRAAAPSVTGGAATACPAPWNFGGRIGPTLVIMTTICEY
jgi:hypothetical protein